MKITKSVIAMNDYGAIKTNLKEVLDNKNISRYELSKAVNTRFEVITKWYNNEVEKMDLDVLARICYVLDCEPSDIIKYEQR